MKVEIVPEYGGMIAQIFLEGKEILHTDYTQMEVAPMAAGGVPILFPFSSKTKNDTYMLNGRQYAMPRHGLVKNDAFAVSEAKEDHVRLWLENSPSWKERYYPFDFRLEIEYRLRDGSLEIVTRVKNFSDTAMPHYLGLHPFFRTTDKKRASLQQDMQLHYDYEHQEDLPGIMLGDLSQCWDEVLHSPAQGGFCFENEADGYCVYCSMDRAFEALVVYTMAPESICIEPWCGLPDSINTGRFLKWVEPGEQKEYQVRMHVESVAYSCSVRGSEISDNGAK
ncbi:MAG: hypothetical protein Q4B57_02595 [Eubacteriales bacterium]|nr:hypothetical protein [Eubacteriales bacterium]